MANQSQQPTLLDVLLRLNKYVKENPSNLESLKECIYSHPVIYCDNVPLAIECARGCFRFSKLIDTTVTHFFKHPFGETASKMDSPLYRAITYLVIFQFSKLGLEQFTQIIRTQAPRNIYFYLSYLLDQENIQTWFYQEWCKSYDTEFIDNNIRKPLLNISEELCDYLQILNNKIDSKQIPKLPSIPKIPNTQTLLFNLTQSKPKPKPEPEEVSIKLHYKPVDPKIYQEPNEITQIERARENNRKNAGKKLLEAQKNRPRCSNWEKSDKTKAKIQEIMDERDSAFTESHTRKAKPYIPPKQDDNLVKKNAASILREGIIFQKEEQKKIQEILHLEAGGKDAGEYYRWQGTVLEEQLEKEQFEIEKKHLLGRITYEEAIIAKQQLSEDNKVLVEQLKEERQALLEEYFKQREEEKKKMQRLVEEIAAGKENAKLAQENLKEMKRKIVEQVSRENKAMMQAAIEMAQAEMEKKMEMIQQIRAMEKVPIIRVQFFDTTETGGHGLLSEMSVAELNERINLMKIAMQEDEEKKRNEINLGKKERNEMLESTIEYIKEARYNQQLESAKNKNVLSTKQASKKAQTNPEVLALKERLLSSQNVRREKKELLSSPKHSSKKEEVFRSANIPNKSVLAGIL
ncbi:hypothetical protein LOD99_4594 [Oopsacas minuta]|uniref:Uncharacterized protein n=1 Tax=Oopsacas minuta TaxID=111878 RepID=A0AAV7JT46_9METZ|nr:hypothetical protein LOD99_4594 [Oopsacas minuta]